MQETSTEYKEFKADYKEKRRDVNTTVKKRFLGKVAAPGALPPKVHIPNWRAHEGVPVEEARLYLPPTATLWCSDEGHGNWQGHFKPYRRISRSWRKYGGSNQALEIVMYYLWSNYADSNGWEVDEVAANLNFMSAPVDAAPAPAVVGPAPAS